MAEPQDRISQLGAGGPDTGSRWRLGPTEWIAAGISLVWLVASVAYALLSPGGLGALGVVMTLIMVGLPIALIWVTLTTLRSVQDLRAEAMRLQAAIEAMRTAPAAPPAAERRGDDGAPAIRPAEPLVRPRGPAPAAAERKAPAPAAARIAADEQPALALGTPAEDLQAPLVVADFIRALQFPESPDDKDGFRALRLALEDRKVAKLIRAAQDVLTLLAQEGIYMDDLRPDRARPELWRAFAQGERGRAVSGLGGIRDRSSLALAAGRMREDPVFRDAAHHFLRTFDRTFQDFEKSATDAELVELSDTRTARAFMLMGRVAGVFD